MAATETNTVTLSIDGRELTVPKGTPLVIAAAQGGIEIPVFCYEPRLGPAVGACRMCLVEIEGMPKLQAACTMVATDGMNVLTRSGKAASGQAAVLEFILLNHPLDCPVCDKGGECPLQDLTYRYGPGNTRFHLPKRTYEKPVPVSPLIALDRERCILCYRCTRFSGDVAEDEQLIARERGSSSIIATFEERPYVGAFSGNVIELCPVGALTSTEYRFQARPWEINNIPTVCGLCPTGCNTWATIREGGVQRVLSRNHPELDEGWLCDKGRFAYQHLKAPDRYTGPLLRGQRGLDDASYADVVASVARRLRHYVNLYGPESVAVVASGEQTNEELHAWALAVEAAGGGSLLATPDQATGALERLDPYAARIADLDQADVVVVAGNRELHDAGGVLDLRLRKAVRRGARLVLAGAGGTALDRDAVDRLAAPGIATAPVLQGLLEALRDAERPVVLVTDPVDLDWLVRLAHDAGLHQKPGGILALPQSPNERGARRVGFDADAAGVLARAEAGELKLLVVLGDADPISAWPQPERWRTAVQKADAVVAVTMFPNEVTGWAHVIVPATAALEKEGSFTNLEGRTQRLRPALPPPDGVVDELAFAVAVANELGVALEAFAPAVHRSLAARVPAFEGSTWEAAGERAALPPRDTSAAMPPPPSRPLPASAGTATSDLLLVAERSLFSGPAVERAPRLHFQRTPEILLNLEDAKRLGIAGGQQVVVRFDGGQVSGPARLSRSLLGGVVRLPWTGARRSGPCTVEAVAGA